MKLDVIVVCLLGILFGRLMTLDVLGVGYVGDSVVFALGFSSMVIAAMLTTITMETVAIVAEDLEEYDDICNEVQPGIGAYTTTALFGAVTFATLMTMTGYA